MTKRLSISNLAWSSEDHANALPRLADLGVEGIEVAPTRIADWSELTVARLGAYRAQLESAGLRVSSLQAVLFNCPEAQLLGPGAAFEQMLEHMKRIDDIAAELGADVAVFGAPRNRNRGDLDPAGARLLAIERLRLLGEALHSVTLGIEPVPTFYGSNFLTGADAVQEIVAAVDYPRIRLHLDTGCALLAGDAIQDAIHAGCHMLAHFHVAEPELGGFAAPKSDHAAAARALNEVEYDRWISVEMREEPDNSISAVETAVAFVQDIYFHH